MFADGTYLELFNWTSDPPRSNNWADRSTGLIDFALTSLPPSTPDSLHREIEARSRPRADGEPVDLKYTAPSSGGRTRSDGVPVKFTLMRPIPAFGGVSSPVIMSPSGHRKDLPFFCHDVTERNTRIPFDDKSKTTHPCGATGISAVELRFPHARYWTYIKLYEALLGIPAEAKRETLCHEFKIRSPVLGVNASRILTFAEKDEDLVPAQSNPGVAIRGLRLHTDDREEPVLQALGSDGVASTVSLER